MANEDVGALVARVIADTEQFRSEMAKMGQRIDSATGRMNRSLSSLDKNLGSIRAGFGLVAKAAAAFGIALSVRALVQFTTRAINSAAELKGMADRLGTSTEALSELGYVAQQSEVQMNTLTMGLQRMTRRIAEAAQGSGEATGALAELRLNANVLAGLPLEQQFEAIADRMAGVTSESDRVRLAMKLFDSEGVALVQTMGKGAEGIRKLRDEARALGITLSSETAQKADEAKDAVVRMRSAVASLGRDIVIEVAPALELLATKLREAFFPTDQENVTRMLKERQDAVERAAAAFQRLETSSTRSGRQPSPAEETRLKELGEAYQEAVRNLREFERMQRFVNETGTASSAVVAPSYGPRREARPGELDVGPHRDAEAEPGLEDLINARMERETIYTGFLADEFEKRLQASADYVQQRIEQERYLAEQEQAFNQMRLNTTASIVSALAAIAAVDANKSKSRFELHKKLAIASAIASTAAAAAEALRHGPPPWNIAQAAAVAAYGYAQVRQIKATSWQGQGGIAPISAGGGGGFGGNFGSTPTVPFENDRNRDRSVVELHFHGDVYGWDDYIENRVIDGVRRAVNDRDVVIFRGDTAQGAMLGVPG